MNAHNKILSAVVAVLVFTGGYYFGNFVGASKATALAQSHIHTRTFQVWEP